MVTHTCFHVSSAVQSECLTNQARNLAELKFPDKLPGEIFDADTQCKWQFGKHSKQCQFTRGQDICKNLWCFRDTAMCETKFLPAAEGTSCGYGMVGRHMLDVLLYIFGPICSVHIYYAPAIFSGRHL